MASKRIKYEMMDYQEAFHRSQMPMVYLSAGYGAGKTYSLCMKGFQLMSMNKGIPGGILAPDLKMFKRDVLPTFRQICRRFRIPMHWNKQDSVLTFPTTKSEVFVFHAEDAGESIRGPNLGWGLINEVTICDQASFEAFLARIRVADAKLLQLAMSGTPEGFNWAYDYFIAEPRFDTEVIYGDMRKNKFVAATYADRLVNAYDDLLAQEKVEGKFINTNGKAAIYKFDRQRHSALDVQRIPGLPVYVSIDFNVSPMAATLWNVLPPGSDRTLLGFDEICIDNTDTEELAREIRNRCGDASEIILFPDPAGNARSTKSAKTDIQILREAGFSQIRYHASIKSVKATLQSTNAFFQKNRALLDRKKCKEAIKDLEQCILKPGTNELDKSDQRRTHWLDGIKNMIHYEYPITVGAGGWRTEKVR